MRVDGTAVRLLSSDSIGLFSYGADPQIYLPELPDPGKEEAIEVELEMEVDLEFTAVRRLVEQPNELESKQKAQTQEKLALEQLYVSREEALQEQIAQIREINLAIVAERERVYGDLGHMLREAEALRTQRDALKEDHDKVSANLTRSRNEEEALKSQVSRCRLTDDQLKTELAKVRDKLTVVEEELATVTKELNIELATVKEDLARERATRSQLEQSRSWKLTKPLRDSVALFRRNHKLQD